MHSCINIYAHSWLKPVSKNQNLCSNQEVFVRFEHGFIMTMLKMGPVRVVLYGITWKRLIILLMPL